MSSSSSACAWRCSEKRKSWTPGTFLGLRGWHGRGHLLRALMEGVVLNHRWHVDALCSKLPVAGAAARLTGGAADRLRPGV
ncbi:hypothetical protein ABT373_32945 [Streptomyces sp. NPDC000070]|uniref:hypothetical protein n=1 Tax=Streptomyces sp. NPDC000070 TaxID=3154240 RepID=UPI00332104E3